MARKIVVSVVLAAAVLAVGIGGYVALVATAKRPETVDPEHVVLTVNAVRLKPVTVVAPVEGFGTARADRRAVVSAQVLGQVIEVAAGLRDGVSVCEGRTLVRIDPREYEAHLQRARSQLAADEAALTQIDIEEVNLKRMIQTATDEYEVAEREYTRVRDLLEGGSSSPRELDAARAMMQQARRGLQELERQLEVLPALRAQQQATCALRRADVNLAELAVEHTTIVAPFDGQVEHLLVELGEHVAPGQALVSLLDPELIEVPVELPVSQRSRVREGAGVRLRLESQPGVAWCGRVSRVAPAADTLTRTFSLFVEVSNDAMGNGAERSPLMPGMFVTAEIDGPTLANVMLVPRGSVRQQRVFVCRDGKAYQREVQVEEHLLDQAVVSGLEPGDVVITSNLDVLSDGTPVQPLLDAARELPVMATDTAPRYRVETATSAKTP